VKLEFPFWPVFVLNLKMLFDCSVVAKAAGRSETKDK